MQKTSISWCPGSAARRCSRWLTAVCSSVLTRCDSFGAISILGIAAGHRSRLHAYWRVGTRGGYRWRFVSVAAVAAILIVLGRWTSSLRILRLWIWAECDATGAHMQHSPSAFPLRYARAAELRAERVAQARQRNLQRYNAALDREIASSTPRPISKVAASLGLAALSLPYYSPERSAQLVARRESFYSTRQRGLRGRLHARLVAALQVRGGPTVRGIARSLGIKAFVALSLCPEESRLLREQRARELKDASARCVAAMREDLARPRPHGVYWVAGQLGISPGKLQRADPQLYRTAAQAHAEALRARRLRLGQALERELRSDSPRSARAVALECGVCPRVAARYCPEPYRRLVELRKRLRGVH